MPRQSDLTTIVLVDDHALVREGVREILEAEDDLEVVGEASDSEGAVRLAEQRKPNVMLLDVGIPGARAPVTVSRIRVRSPGTRVIILSMYDDPALLKELLTLGIKGYLLKSVTRHELIAAVRSARVDDGRVLLSVSQATLAQPPGDEAAVLSARELTVLQLVAGALSNAQIGTRLSLTEATVKRHLRNIFHKLGAVSRIDAVNKAIAAGLIEAPLPRHEPPPASRRQSSASPPGL